jgi:8-oxo-dGTP pyrophosphatase MutT (NUDIX family)
MSDPAEGPIYHPRRDDHGKRIRIKRPTKPSGPETWTDSTAVAVFAPESPVPPMLNDVPVGPIVPPTSVEGWTKLVKVWSKLPPPKTSGDLAAGAVIIEPDGRVWLSQPTNGFGGYEHQTFPKGTKEAGYSLESTAAKEVFEETGLLIEIGAFVADRHGDKGVTRFFLGRRIGGTPSAMCWETQGVWLVPLTKVRGHATSYKDAPVVRAVLSDSSSPSFPVGRS